MLQNEIIKYSIGSRKEAKLERPIANEARLEFSQTIVRPASLPETHEQGWMNIRV